MIRASRSLKALLIGVVIAGAAVALAPTREVSQVMSSRGSTSYVTTPSEAWVFVSVTDFGWSGSSASNLLIGLGRLAGHWGPTDRDRRDQMTVLFLDQAGLKQSTVSGSGLFHGVVDGAIIVSNTGRLHRAENGTLVPLTKAEDTSIAPRLTGRTDDVPRGWTAERLVVTPARLERALTVGRSTFTLLLDHDGDVERLRVRDEHGATRAELTVDRRARSIDRASYGRHFGR